MNVLHTPLFFDVFRYRPTEGTEDFRGEAWHRDASGYARVHEVRLACWESLGWHVGATRDSWRRQARQGVDRIM
jgi:hypothetical protein